MIEWGAPWAFVLLLPALAVPLAPRLTGRRRLTVSNLSQFRRERTLKVLLAPVPSVLQVLALVLMVFALARPRITHRETLVESQGLDILLALDVSGSMAADDFTVRGMRVSRLDVAKGVVADFVQGRPNDRIGLVVFGEEAFTQVPLTLDTDALVDAVKRVELGIAGQRATAIGSAIAVSSKRLKELEAPSRVLILLTDGKSNAGRLEPQQAAQAAAALGIRIYTIGVGGGGGRGVMDLLLNQRSDLDERTLAEVAEITGGRYFRARDTETLMAVYETIDALETSPAEVREFVEHTELFRYPLVPGAVLFVLQLLLSSTWLRRWP